MSTKHLSENDQNKLLETLKSRFEKNMKRHEGVKWNDVEVSLAKNPEKLWSLNEMEKTGGEPDVVRIDNDVKGFVFVDCSNESPSGRRSLCYDRKAWESRKEHKPKNTVLDMAQDMGVEILSGAEYRELQNFGEFDLKSSSWVKTPDSIRKLGGAIFCDRRYDAVFTYHNGADSYYAARGFRAKIMV
ncbi:MAG: DUF4256 domain-containing protein [Patescibacteria group bacterium]